MKKKIALITGMTGKAKKILKWKPKITIDELIKEMVEAELKKLKYS